MGARRNGTLFEISKTRARSPLKCNARNLNLNLKFDISAERHSAVNLRPRAVLVAQLRNALCVNYVTAVEQRVDKKMKWPAAIT